MRSTTYMSMFVSSLGLFMLLPSFAHAVVIEPQTADQRVAVGAPFTVDIVLDVEETVINAIEANITFPGDMLELRAIDDGNSIISLWLEGAVPPEAACTDRCIVRLSGIVPGGFGGIVGPGRERSSDGNILTFQFVGKHAGDATIRVNSALVLLNDGEGTPASTRSAPLTIVVVEPQVKVEEELPQPFTDDLLPPEAFFPRITSNPTVFDGNWFVVFATQDKGSGIDHYAVAERRGGIIENYNLLRWRRADSPHELSDQSRRSGVYVKAVDRAGNERIVALPPRYAVTPYYTSTLFWGMVILFMLVVAAFFVRRFRPPEN